MDVHPPLWYLYASFWPNLSLCVNRSSGVNQPLDKGPDKLRTTAVFLQDLLELPLQVVVDLGP